MIPSLTCPSGDLRLEFMEPLDHQRWIVTPPKPKWCKNWIFRSTLDPRSGQMPVCLLNLSQNTVLALDHLAILAFFPSWVWTKAGMSFSPIMVAPFLRSFLSKRGKKRQMCSSSNDMTCMAKYWWHCYWSCPTTMIKTSSSYHLYPLRAAPDVCLKLNGHQVYSKPSFGFREGVGGSFSWLKLNYERA